MNNKFMSYTAIILAITFASCINKKPLSKSGESNRNKAVALQVMTYNVHHCNPPGKAKEGIIDINAISNLIKAEGADIVALQEIDDHTTRSGTNINEAEVIAKQLGMYYYFGKAIDFGGGGYGTAILSKYPISEEQKSFLPKSADESKEQRVLIAVKVDLKNGKSIRFGCTHLDAGNAKNRELQAIEINRITRSESLPFILCGDFNDVVGSKPMLELEKNFQRNCDPCEYTIPADHPKSAIDFILVDKKHDLKVSSYKVVSETHASDHRPVTAIITVF